ncbi:MAG TPA: GNAT family N-acetyltransferase [Tepidisphaeraceae bacterium]|nr:GNAT family N-acetyltransferase [Tepidisphaeraceae bacterium]
MPQLDIHLESAVPDTFRVQQIAGMFDLGLALATRRHVRAEVPDPTEPWQVGLIVGPSGSGKTTVAGHAFGGALYQPRPWPTDRAVIDCFGDLPIKQLARTLTAVGFSTPPAWLRPYHHLSTGEQFRCDLAAALLGREGAETRGHGDAKKGPEFVSASSRPRVSASPPTTVFDEFTSVVDRTIARFSSCALSKAIRSGIIPRRFVAVTCHDDIAPWLCPDWVLDMTDGSLSRRRLRRPPIHLQIQRTDRSFWNFFSPHHYLTHDLHRSAFCFLARVDNKPAAFTAVLPFPHPRRPGWREHRTVCLPDFQGVGIGTTMSNFVASLFVATGKPYFSRTSHPAMIAHRLSSPSWKLLRPIGMVSRSGRSSRDKTEMADTISRGRNTAGFEYIGPARADEAARFAIV